MFSSPCIEAVRAPKFAGRKVPTFTGPAGGVVDKGGAGVGKVVDSSATRAAIGWQPQYKTFGAFIDTLV